MEVFDRVYRKKPGISASTPLMSSVGHMWVNPFHEEDMSHLVEMLGADRVMFGSDFPHPEGLAEPADFVSELDGLPADTPRRSWARNLKQLIGI